MGILVVNGAQLQCTGAVPPGTSAMMVLPTNKVLAGGQPAANIMDNKPMVNVMSFGMCQLPSNPQVAAATAAAQGVLTPQPCVPIIPASWIPGSPTVHIGGQPALNNSSSCLCQWAGKISVINPGQATVQVA